MAETCPKCGLPDVEGDLCPRCRVIISKYKTYLQSGIYQQSLGEGAQVRPQAEPTGGQVVAIEKRIGFGRRLGAWLVDVVLVTVLSFVVGPVVGWLVGARLGGAAGGSQGAAAGAAFGGLLGAMVGAMVGFLIGLLVLGTLYYLIEGFTGWTLGKLALGIRIRSADGTNAGLGRLLGRYAVKNIGFLLGLLGFVTGVRILSLLSTFGALAIFIGCFFTLGADRQALHDKVVGTAVFRKADIRAAA